MMILIYIYILMILKDWWQADNGNLMMPMGHWCWTFATGNDPVLQSTWPSSALAVRQRIGLGQRFSLCSVGSLKVRHWKNSKCNKTVIDHWNITYHKNQMICFEKIVLTRNKFPLPSTGVTRVFAPAGKLGVATSFNFCISSNWWCKRLSSVKCFMFSCNLCNSCKAHSSAWWRIEACNSVARTVRMDSCF